MWWRRVGREDLAWWFRRRLARYPVRGLSGMFRTSEMEGVTRSGRVLYLLGRSLDIVQEVSVSRVDCGCVDELLDIFNSNGWYSVCTCANKR